MNPILRNVLAVIAGLVVGGAVNMGLVTISGSVIPPPEGVNPADLESLRANIHLFQPQHFVFPFLAHALGTLVGAAVAARLAATRAMAMAFIIGCFNLAGGIAAATLIPAPAWFIVLDLAGAYLPMAWLGGRLAARAPRS